MNANTFRLIFSKRLGMRVPVAEQHSAQGKVASDKTAEGVLKPLALSLALLCATPALALPVAPTVANGSVSFSQSGSTLTVTNTPNAIINWGSFSIGQSELTQFIQQSSASAVLNRVTGQSPSQILGQLQSNGRVFLINPNGIVFGQGARINTAGLIASTLKLSDADFLAGRLRFSGTGSEAKVDNQGTINTAQGGFVYLIAPNVENSGIINAPNGDVLLAAGHSVEIADGLNPALRVVLTAPEGSVVNLGQVLAESGRIGLHGGMVSNSGIVSASSAVAEGGKIYLRATEKIELTETSNLTADGTVGGEITAITQKDGQIAGELVARGEISAQGSGTVGSGGFVETSAAKLNLNGVTVNTNGGQWLLDPIDFTIDNVEGDITGSALSTALESNNVTIQTTSDNATGNGDIFVYDDVTWTAATTLTLLADRNITIDQSISGNTMAFTAPGGVTNNGTISPGGVGQIGTLNVTGDLVLGANSILNIDLGGTGVGQSDRVNVSGTITMAGALERSLIPGYTPALGDAIPFISATVSSSGTFRIIDYLTNLVTGYRLAPGEAARQIFSGSGYNTFTNFVGGWTWDVGGNWSEGFIPNAGQTAIITSSPLSPVTHSTGTDSIAGLLLSAGTALSISGGSLAVSGTTSVGGTLNLTGGTYYNNGTLNVTSTGIFNLSGGTLGGSGSMNNAGTMSLANQTITNAITNSGTFNSGGGLTFTQLFTNQGTFNVKSGMTTFSNGFTQTAGNLVFGGGNATGNLTLNGGSLSGAGTMTGNVSLGAATLAPGASPGTLNITGNLTLSPTSTTLIELWGTTAGLFDVINVSGIASLAGALNATTGNGYVPGVGHALRFMTFASKTGSFGSTSLPSGMRLSALATALDLLGPAALPPGVSSTVNQVNNSLNLGAVTYETPFLYITGQSSPTASSSGTLTQTAEIVLPNLMPQTTSTGDSGDEASSGSEFASLLPLFDQLVRDASFKDTPHDSRLICR